MSEVIDQLMTAGGVTVMVCAGDLTTEPTDAIVNAANSQLAHGGGVAGAIARRGGPSIQAESDRWVREHGQVPTGGVALTTAGHLPCQKVIHAVGPVWQGGGRGEPEQLRQAVRNSLELAARESCASIALPAISSGIFGFPKPLCAAIMVDEALAFAAEQPEGPVREIRFITIDQQTVELFAAELAGRK